MCGLVNEGEVLVEMKVANSSLSMFVSARFDFCYKECQYYFSNAITCSAYIFL